MKKLSVNHRALSARNDFFPKNFYLPLQIFESGDKMIRAADTPPRESEAYYFFCGTEVEVNETHRVRQR